jgi:hypothetical protein
MIRMTRMHCGINLRGRRPSTPSRRDLKTRASREDSSSPLDFGILKWVLPQFPCRCLVARNDPKHEKAEMFYC